MKELKKYFIGRSQKYCELYNHENASWFRKTFCVDKTENARIFICGLGFYELYLNGQNITKGKLAPYISNPDEIMYYDSYDVSDMLYKGQNAVGIILGNGFLNNMGGHPWGFDQAKFRSAPMFAMILVVDGKEIFHSDQSFKTAKSPILFDDLRCGEYYDARLFRDGWSLPSFDDREWENAVPVYPPNGELKLCTAEPVRIIEQRKPVSYWLSDGGVMFDFGVNSAGICRISFNGNEGRKIVLWHCECLTTERTFYNKNTCTPDFDRNLSQKDIFICNGKQTTYEPSFTYHGFRYVFVEGIDECELNNFSILMLVLSSDLEKTGEFMCSDEVVNKLQKTTINSDLSNFLYFPTDCPQREKNGWTGDAALSAEQILYNFDCSNSLSVWLENIRSSQRNGVLPGVVPTVEFGYTWGNGPAWDKVLIELPYQIYRFTGDITVLRDNAEAIYIYLLYVKTKENAEGLFAYGLPDWCETGSISEDRCSTPLEVSDTLTVIDFSDKACLIFKKLNMTNEYLLAEQINYNARRNFREKYLTENSEVSCHTQTAQAMALSVNIFSEEEKTQAVLQLVKMIQEKENRFCVGVLGARVLFRVLADNGYHELALKLITQDGFPSYKYWLDNGATSLWEAFNEVTLGGTFRKDGRRTLSLNHHFWGDISAWFYRYISGIDVDYFREDVPFKISPKTFEKVDFVIGSYIRNGKGVKVKIEKINGRMKVDVVSIGNVKYVIE